VAKTVGQRSAPLLLAVASTLLTLLVLELAARLVRRADGGGKEASEVGRYHEYDPILGWSKTPGARAVYRRREYTVEVTINRHGLRDPERGYDAPPGTTRILALGDSFIEGYTVALPRTVTQVLESSLNGAGCPAQVINGGTAGYSNDQELLFYETEGHRYAPQVVVLFFHYNDVVYNDRQDYFGAPKPIFQMGEGALCIHRVPVRRPAGRVALEPAAETPESGSALLEWVRERLWYGAPGAYDVAARFGLWEPMPRMGTRLELRVYERRRVEPVEDAWAKTAAILAALGEQARSRGARLLVAYIPSRLEIDDRTWRLTRRLYGWDETGWDRGRVAQRVKEIGTQAGIPVLDLTDPLRRADESEGRTYFTYDGHWTAIGHRVAAREVQRFLAARGWLPGCATSRAGTERTRGPEADAGR
jgi:lysophospholipase L1-like esterase